MNASDYYYATYDFRDDIIGGNPEGFLIQETTGTINVIASLGEHRNVVEIYDTGASYIQIAQVFTAGNQKVGIIEFWIRGNDTTRYIQIWLSPAGVLFRINAGIIQYHYGGTWHSAVEGGILNNIWYHIKIIFDYTIDVYDFYLNDIVIDTNISFSGVQTYCSILYFRTHSTYQDYKFYIDAIGYSWDFDYNIGDNKFPELNMTNILTPIFSLLFLIFLMILMIFLYMKVKIWLVILVLFLFSLIIGIYSLSLEYIPFNPYFSILFILFQSVFFLKKSLEVYKM